ncbi:MAG: DUF1961 family protein [Lentisphaerae bacterium]|nr:DUF1961 family protein [Lentisphaerota bacterium]
MPIAYANLELLQRDDFADAAQWHHEGAGEIKLLPEGGLRLHCFGSRQGAEGCMAFFRPTLPDHIAIEYDIIVHSHGGLVINYLAIRGLQGEDLIADLAKLPPRTGIMADYYANRTGLQSYHISFSRFDDDGRHTGTSNWRRNPGCRLIGHGSDPCKELKRRYSLRLVKDAGHCQLFVDGNFAHGFIDWDHARPIPDTGKFGFRLIGSDVMADVFALRVYRVPPNMSVWHICEE